MKENWAVFLLLKNQSNVIIWPLIHDKIKVEIGTENILTQASAIFMPVSVSQDPLEWSCFFRKNSIPLYLRNLGFYPLLLHLGASTKQTFQECNLYKTRSTTILLGSAHSTFNPCNSFYYTYLRPRLRPTYLPIILTNQNEMKSRMYWLEGMLDSLYSWFI